MAEEGRVLQGVVPWGIHPLPDFVKAELESRPAKYAMDDNAFGTPTPISSVRSAWVRVCSNGVPTNKNHPASGSHSGFVFLGPNLNSSTGFPVDFNSTFGFNKVGDQVIGYTVNGGLHYLESTTFPNRPPPGIVSIDTEFYGAGSSFPGMCRKATLKWKCYSMEQLEYLTPYLMALKVSMILEWGWNDYNPASLIDLTDPKKLLEIFKFPDVSEATTKTIFERISTSKGNYDCQVGRIINFGYTMNSQGNYDGFTEVVHPTAMFEGNSIVNQATSKKEDGTAKSFKEFIKNNFDCLSRAFNSDTGRMHSQYTTGGLEYFKNQITEDFLDYIGSDPNRMDFRVFRFVLTDHQHGKPSAKFWINFRLFESILNYFATINETSVPAAPLFTFRLRDVIISGRPVIKSVCNKPADLNVIIPNMYAPRLMRDKNTSDSKSTLLAALRESAIGPLIPDPNSGKATAHAGGTYSGVVDNPSFQTPDNKFAETAKAIKGELDKRGFVDTVDDLQKVTYAVNSFPRYSKLPAGSNPNDMERDSAPGFWGELGDIYISNELIKRAVESNDTFLKMLEAILAEVAVAGSGIWEFKVIPNGMNGVTVMDTTYCPIYDAKQIDKLVKFTIGQTHSSAFTEYSMDIKMVMEMALQAQLGAQSSVDPKRVDMFTQEDRLYDIPGSFTMVGDNNVKLTEEEKRRAAIAQEAAAKAEEAKLNERATDEGFVVLHRYFEGVDYYFNEKDPELMKQLIQIKSKSDPSATPVFPGTEFSFSMPGIAGFTFLALFVLDAVPAPYSYKRALFQVKTVTNSISGNNWKTSVVAQVRPLSTATG